MPSVLTLSPFSGDTGSRCSHAMFTTLSSSGMNNEHIPPYNNLSCIKYTFQSSRLPVNYMDYVNFSKFIIEPSECKNNSFKASNSKTIAFCFKIKVEDTCMKSSLWPDTIYSHVYWLYSL